MTTCTTGTDGNGNAITTLYASTGSPFATATVGTPVVINNQAFTIETVVSPSTVVVEGTANDAGSAFSVAGFSALQYVPDVCLDQITIAFASLTPELLIDGSLAATAPFRPPPARTWR